MKNTVLLNQSTSQTGCSKIVKSKIVPTLQQHLEPTELNLLLASLNWTNASLQARNNSSGGWQTRPNICDCPHAWVCDKWYQERIWPGCTDAGVHTNLLNRTIWINTAAKKCTNNCLCYSLLKCCECPKNLPRSTTPDINFWLEINSCMINQRQLYYSDQS